MLQHLCNLCYAEVWVGRDNKRQREGKMRGGEREEREKGQRV